MGLSFLFFIFLGLIIVHWTAGFPAWAHRRAEVGDERAAPSLLAGLQAGEVSMNRLDMIIAAGLQHVPYANYPCSSHLAEEVTSLTHAGRRGCFSHHQPRRGSHKPKGQLYISGVDRSHAARKL